MFQYIKTVAKGEAIK